MFNILGQETKFEKLAEIAANDYLENKVPLNDSIVKIAEQEELNPEQIKRVVEAANIKVFQKHFGDDDREGHKDVDFDVAEPQAIIKRIYVVKSPESPVSEDISSSPLDFFKDLGSDSFRDRKQPEVEDLPEEKIKLNRPTLVLRIKTAKANLETKALELSDDYTKLAQEIAKDYRRSDAEKNSFDNLVKEAYEHFGNKYDDELASVATHARKEFTPKTEWLLVKIAGFPSGNLEKLGKLNKIAGEYLRHVKAIGLAEDQLKDMME